uniref:Reverse transcriptase domain-containing protein n=1 Tax=Tanacetum cinerariifolium TaxID=118510 RepID=A0A6L2L887_TANCI|nr:hypothetical protein [Tanacetum cinerariifolium]
MRTRSSSNLIVESFTIPKRRNHRRSKQIVEPELRTIKEIPVATMANMRTMSELLQAPTEGYGDVIVIPAILADDFELKVELLQLVTSSQFHGIETDEPNAHIRSFNINSMLKYKNVPNDAIKLTLFPFSLEGAARTWLEKEPPRSIHTWEDLVSKFVNYLFPPSSLKNDTTVASGNLLNRTPRDALTIIENKSKELVLTNKANQQASVKAIEETCVTCGGGNEYRPQGDPNYRVSNQMGPPGFPPSNMQNNQNRYNQNQGNYQAPNNQAQVGPSNDFSNYMNTNDVNMRAMRNQISNMKTELKKEFKTKMLNQNSELRNMMSSYIQIQSPSGSGSLPSNTIANPGGDVKAITTQSGFSYDGPTIPPTHSPLSKSPMLLRSLNRQVLILQGLMTKSSERNHNSQILKFLQFFQRLHFDLSFADALLHIPKFASTFKSLLANKEKLFELANTSSIDNCLAILLKKLPEKLRDPRKFLIPCDFQGFESCMALADLAGIAVDVFVQVGKFTFPANFVVVDYDADSCVPLILGRPFLRTARALVDVHGEEPFLRAGDEQLIFHADSTSKHPHKHGNDTTPLSDSSPSLTPFETSDSLLEEEMEYLLNQDPSTESNIEIIDPILAKFTDEPSLDYLPPPGDDDDNDDLFDLKSDNDE